MREAVIKVVRIWEHMPPGLIQSSWRRADVLPLDGPPPAIDNKVKRAQDIDRVRGLIANLPGGDIMTDPQVGITGSKLANLVSALMHATDFLIQDDPDQPNSPTLTLRTLILILTLILSLNMATTEAVALAPLALSRRRSNSLVFLFSTHSLVFVRAYVFLKSTGGSTKFSMCIRL